MKFARHPASDEAAPAQLSRGVRRIPGRQAARKLHSVGLTPGSVVLQALRQADGHLSGAHLAGRLGVSRSAVWKHIQGLRADGYAIEGQPRRGYRLLGPKDVLTAEVLLPRLRSTTVGRRIEHHEITGSTMDDARDLAQAEAPEGTVVIAELQTGGRGRRGREWLSPRSYGITASIILRPPIPPSVAQHLSLLAALGTAMGVREATSAPAAVKWPNDVVLEGKKLGGVLIELIAEADRIRAAIVGIGLNVNGTGVNRLAGLLGPAITLEEHLGHSADRAAVLCRVLESLEQLYRNYCATGPDDLLAQWRSMDVCLGQHVQAVSGEQRLEGLATDIRDDAALQLSLPDGSSVFLLAGDVLLRGGDDAGPTAPYPAAP